MDVGRITENSGTAAEDRDGCCQCCFDLDRKRAIESDNTRAINVDPDDQIVSIQRDARMMAKSAALGCTTCSIIVKVLVFFGLDLSQDPAKISLRFPIRTGNLELHCKVFGASAIVQLYTPLSHGKAWKSIQPLPEICTDHLSPESLSFIKSCLKACLDNHTICYRDGGRLPTRLLDIGARDEQVARLVETKTLENVQYIALSYCWGKSPPMMTTLDTLGMMKDGIQVSALTRAYLDAVTLARELGVRYLWIDALCIIQDYHEDWERESTMMGDIYSNALLTVAASSSKSATEAFLRRGDDPDPDTPERHPEIFTEVVQIGEDQVTIKARKIEQEGAHWRWHDDAEQRQLQEPLSQRGWTLQEQLLSGRFLSISSTEMQWTCNEAVFCECRSRLNHRREFGHMPISQISKPEQALRFWHKVIENYSRRLLTQQEDKLPAISAIAAVLQEKTGFRYVAGLWAENVHLDLLWRRTGELQALPPRAPEFIAPSFSWASVHGEIDYYCFRNGKDPYRKSAEVLAVQAGASPNAPLGRVGSGTMTIRGPVTPGHLRYLDAEGNLVVRMGRVQLQVVADTKIQEVAVPGPDGGAALTKTACRWSPLLIDKKKDEPDAEPAASAAGTEDAVRHGSGGTLVQGRFAPATQCWVLRLGSFQMTRQRKEHELMVLGKSPTDPAAYQRLGLGSCEDDGRAVALFEGEHETTVTLV